MHKHRFKHVGEHVLDLLHVLLELLALGHQHLEALAGALVTRLQPLRLVLPQAVVAVYTRQQGHVHQCCHKLHHCEGNS